MSLASVKLTHQLAPKAAVLCERLPLAIQGHSRSPILVPIEAHARLPVSEQYQLVVLSRALSELWRRIGQTRFWL